MQEILIYGGIGINIVGAIFLMAYAIKYAYAFKKSSGNEIETNALKPEWAKMRAIGFGMIILGSILALIGCYL